MVIPVGSAELSVVSFCFIGFAMDIVEVNSMNVVRISREGFFIGVLLAGTCKILIHKGISINIEK